MANIVAQMQVLISAQTKGLNTALSQSQTALKTFGSAISATNNILTSFGVGFGLFKVTQAVGDAVGTIRDFGRQMRIIEAITGATNSELDDLRELFIDLGKTTQFSSIQVAEMATELGRLGFTVPEILAAANGITTLATATGEDLAKSADTVGSTIRSFGLAATDTQKVVDIMAESFNKSALSLENFTESIKFVAPIAHQAGISLEETTAMLGILADNGIRGSLAGTSLRKIITDLGGETGTLSEKFAKLAAKGLTGADAMSEVGRTAYASLLILANNASKTDALTIGLNNVAGAAQKAADIVGDDLEGDLKRLSSTYDAVILSNQGLEGEFRKLVQATTAFLRDVEKIRNFFSDTPLSVAELNKELEILNKNREHAIQVGNRRVEREMTLEIIELTNKYRLLKPAVEESTKALTDSATAVTELGTALVPAVGLIQGLEDKLKVLEEKKKKSFSADEIRDFNEEIANLRLELELLNSTHSLSGFGKSIIDKAAFDFQIPELTTPEGIEDIFPTTIPVPDIEPAMAALQTYTDAIINSGVQGIYSADQIMLANEQIIASEQRKAAMAQQVGQIFGDTVGDVISGQKTVVQGIKAATAKLLPILLAQALAGTIAGAGKTTAPPPVIIALAAAGVAAISALFSKATGHSGGGGGGASLGGKATTNVSRLQPTTPFGESISFDAKFKLEGNDLVASANSTNKTNGRLSGG